MTSNLQIRLASRPKGQLKETNFKSVKTEIPVISSNELLIKNLWLSIDPYVRGRMNLVKSYANNLEIGDVVFGGTVGVVIESKNQKFKTGDHVVGNLGWQNFASSNGDGLRKINPGNIPLSAHLGACGMPGVAAWIGIIEHCTPKQGDVVLVSAATGAVGGVVGQLAKLHGCTAIGIAGGKAKCDFAVQSLGYDACIDYKNKNFAQALRSACPSGVDCYFENVGGKIFEVALGLLKPFSRVAMCGFIADYNTLKPYGVKNLKSLLLNRVKLQGFIVTDRPDLYAKATSELIELVSQGKIKYHETIHEGLKTAPRALMDLLAGKNFGKQLVKLF